MKLKDFKKEISSTRLLGIDTMVFIYLLEGQEPYFSLVKPVFVLMEKGEIRVVSSFISYIETLSSPRLNLEKIDLYSRFFLENKNLFLKEIDWKISEYAAFLRRTYKLRTPDAIQMATAIVNENDLFISNDESLKKVKETKTLVLKDFV